MIVSINSSQSKDISTSTEVIRLRVIRLCSLQPVIIFGSLYLSEYPHYPCPKLSLEKIIINIKIVPKIMNH
jgi:hypothetical protein